MDSPFGVHVHHPRFLEWEGAPETARLLCRPPVEWLQVMNRRDTLYAALQLQRDASLMSSNLTVLNDAVPVPCVLRAPTHIAAMCNDRTFLCGYA